MKDSVANKLGAKLGAYRQDLIKQGFDATQAFELVLEAVRSGAFDFDN